MNIQSIQAIAARTSQIIVVGRTTVRLMHPRPPRCPQGSAGIVRVATYNRYKIGRML